MITYNAGRRFFALKAEAESHRRALGLPKERLYKIQIDDREQLTELLNGLASGAHEAAPVPQTPLPDPAFDFVPEFIRRDWQRRQAMFDRRNEQ